MTTTEKPEIGKSAEANGIRTNYLEAGSGDETVLLIHGSGPGVTSYANWRLVIPSLAENFHVIAPDMVGFGFSDRPEGVNYGLNKVRFPAPLRVDSRIRMRVQVAEVKAIDGPGGQGAEAVYRLTYEVEGQDKPCCVADLVFRYYP